MKIKKRIFRGLDLRGYPPLVMGRPVSMRSFGQSLRLLGTRSIIYIFICLQLSALSALFPAGKVLAAAPTIANYTGSNWTDSSASDTTGTLTWSSGDTVLVMGVTENGNRTFNTPTATGLTFSLVTSINSGESGDCLVYVWSATAGSSGSSAVSATSSDGVAARGLGAYAISGSDGLGNLGTLEGSANKVVDLTRAYNNSAVVTMMGDWNAVNDTSVTTDPSGGTVRQTAFASGAATFFLNDWADEGTAGQTNYGISGHTGTVVMSGIAVEVRGTSGPAPNALPLASSTSETQQTTTSTTYTASDTSISSGSLPAGTYLVAWGAAVANNNANEITWARLVRGSTVIAELGSEANAATAANNGRSPGGYWLGTLSGSESLTIEYRVTLNTTTGYIDSKSIKAMRLDTYLTADSDYWTTGAQESGSDEVTNAGTASYTTVKTLTKTFNASGAEDYIALASMEISPDNATNDCNAKLVVDGSDVSVQTQEGEDTTDIYGYIVADMINVGSGSKTLTLQGQSVGSATCDFLRSRIYVLRASVFDQVLENESLAESTLASATWTTKTTQAYTPNQSENVMVLTNQQLGSNAAASPAATRINNTTDTVVYGDTRSHAVNNVTPDYYTNMTAASLSMSSAKTFTGQYQRVTGTGTVKIKNARILVWSMTLKAPALKQSVYRWFNNSQIDSWWNSSWTERRKITLDNSDSGTDLTNFPIRVSLVGSGGGQNIDYSKTQNAGQDIRFTDADGNTVLKHEIEAWNESGTSEVWVKVPQIDSGSTTDYIWMYYNNASASDGQDVANVWSNGYISVWHLGESPAGGAPQFNDSAVANDGTANGMVSGDSVAGQIGNAVNFDGTDNEITTATSYNNPQGFTVSAWAKTTSSAGRKIIGLETDDSWDRMLVVDTAGKARFGIYDGSFNVITSTTTVNDNAWRNLAATSDGTTNISLYQNGSLEASASAGAAESYTGTWHIGAFRAWTEIGASDGYFNGLIDEVRVSNVVRAADWLEAEYITGTNAMNTFASEETYAGDPGFGPLASQDTAYNLTSANQEFRLRLLLHVSSNFLVAGNQNFKLQYATKSGTCDTGYSGETYDDVGTSSGAIRFKDNASFTDGSAMSPNPNDPTHNSDTITPQTYEESNNFTSVSRINAGADGKWDFALVDSSAPAGTSYCFRVVTSAGVAIATPDVVPEITTAGGNTAPSMPASPAQKKADDSTITTGGWTNETSIKLTATVTDSDGGDTVKICAEVDPIGTAFSSPSGDGDGCSATGVSSGGTATVTISGLSNSTEYHWQVKAKDAAGSYSSWTSYGGNTENPPTNPAERDFGVDTSAPDGGTVYDGTVTNIDKTFSDSSLSALSANWSGFDPSPSGLQKYEYSIGTTQGGTDVKNWTDNSTTTSVTATGLTLQTSKIYYFNVKAYDNAGNTSTQSSDGQMVAPSLSFSLSPTTLSFDNLNAGNSYTDTKTTTTTTSTNAYGGYAIRLAATDLLRSSNNSTIPDFTGGSYVSPDSWQSGDTGFGYTSNDTSVQGSNKFQNTPNCPGGSAHAPPGCYAPYSQTKPGDIIADHTNNVTGSPITNEQFTITHRLTVPATQGASTYTALLLYTITALY